MPKKPPIRNTLKKGRKIKKDRPLLAIDEVVVYKDKFYVKVVGYDFYNLYIHGELFKGHLYIIENEFGFTKTVHYEEIFDIGDN